MQEMLRKLHKNNSGASLLFVLGIMMFLLIIGTSVLLAASTNAGFATNQRERNQIKILDESIHKTIMFSLQNGLDDGDLGTLGRQLAWALYQARVLCESVPCVPDPDGHRCHTSCIVATCNVRHNCLPNIVVYDSATLPNGIRFDDGFGNNFLFTDGGLEATVTNITLAFPTQVITETAHACAIYGWEFFDEDAEELIFELLVPCTPPLATIFANMIVTVTIDINTPNRRTRTVTSRALYQYTEGLISINNVPADAPFLAFPITLEALEQALIDGTVPEPNPLVFCPIFNDPAAFPPGFLVEIIDDDGNTFTNFGIWELISYENIETN